jgi:hypothetical protein
MSVEDSDTAVADELEPGLQALLDSAIEALPIRITESRAYPMHTVSHGDISFQDIPEAVPLQDIPAGVKPQVAIRADLAPLPNKQERTESRRVGALPQKRSISVEDTLQTPEEIKPLDVSRFVKMDEFRDGKFRVEPLQRIPGQNIAPPTPRPKFMDGELPRSVERGLTHPQPLLIRTTAVLLMICQLLLLATIIVGPIKAIEGREAFIQVAWIPITFFAVGLVYLLMARKCRCRVCSCHFFFVKRCFKHRNAHKLRFLGYAGSAALHVILFRWMRCMYCGTAIRMRVPPGEDDTHT